MNKTSQKLGININTVFTDQQDSALQLMQEHYTSRCNTFLIPTKFISTEAASVAFLLSKIFSRLFSIKCNYKTFFTNSYIEAAHGAIKLFRHYQIYKKLPGSTILIIEAKPILQLHLFPDKSIRENPLVRNLSFSSLDAIKALPDDKIHENIEPSAIFITKDVLKDEMVLRKVCAYIKVNNVKFILGVGWPVLDEYDLYGCIPDIIICDESFADNQIPFSSFSMQDYFYQPWNSLSTCLLHSSTYSANRLVLKYILSKLTKYFQGQHDADKIRSVIEKIKTNNTYCRKMFATFINPNLATLYHLAGVDFRVMRANDEILEIKFGNKICKIYDLATGGGAVVNGHNHISIRNVLNSHNNKFNYWLKLKSLFSEITSYNYFLPAVSGASAVDLALTFARLSRSSKRKIVTFANNYSGKTLISLNLSPFEDIQLPFGPLYNDIVVVDPFSKDVELQLTEILKSNDVCLVWFEYIQGATLKAIPDSVIKYLVENKLKYDYLIGIDDVLMGYYRNYTYLSFANKGIQPDIVTLSKGLSGGIFPFGMTLLSDQLYSDCKATCPTVVTFFESYYKNNLGSHVAYECTKYLVDYNNGIRISEQKHISDILEHAFTKVSNNNALIESVEKHGFILKLNFREHKLAHKIFGSDIAEFLDVLIITKYLLEKSGLFLFFERIIPPINLSIETAAKIARSVYSFADMNNFKLKYSVWSLGFKLLLYKKTYFFKEKFKQSIAIMFN